MDVRIENLEPATVVYVRRQGPYDRSAPAAWEALWQWVSQHGRSVDVRGCLGLGHHNPSVTPPNECVYDACVALAGEIAPDAEVGVQTLPGGRYAILTLVGPYSGIRGAYEHLRNEFLPTSGEPTDWRPWFERYLNSPAEVAEADLHTEICMPLAGQVQQA